MKNLLIAMFCLNFFACAVARGQPQPADDGSIEPAPRYELNMIQAPAARVEGVAAPAFNPAWGVNQNLYLKAASFFNANQAAIANHDHFAVVDFSLNEKVERMFIFNVADGSVIRHLVAHGTGSMGPNGFATHFSNESGTHASSLGFYVTLDRFYFAGHGYSLRLKGLSSTNSNVLARGILLHPASYVNEALDHTGHSWGCLAVDPTKSDAIISQLHTGGLIFVGLEF